MAVKLIMLTTREDIICDALELSVNNKDDEKLVVGYRMQKPCQLWMDNETKTASPGVDNHVGRLKLKPFSHLTNDLSIDVKAEDVLAIVEPIPQAVELYNKYILDTDGGKNPAPLVDEALTEDDQTDSTDESTDSDQSD